MAIPRNIAAVTVVVATLAVSSADVVITTDTVQDGGVLAVNPPGALVVHGASNPQLTVTNGAAWQDVFAVIVGTQEGGDGRLLINGGSTVVTQYTGSPIFGIYDGVEPARGHVVAGRGEGSTGIVTVSGAGTQWDGNRYSILGARSQSHGELNVTDGAYLQAGVLQTAQHEGASASVNVVGAGSKLKVSGPWLGNGEASTTNVLIDSGGTIESFGQQTELASSINSNVSLVIRGVGSSWHEYTGMTIGHAGEADVRIEDGGLLWYRGTSPSFDIGYYAGNDFARGTVTVTGAGSTLRSNGTINIGHESTLIAENGGRIIGGARLSEFSSVQNARAIVRGPGSRWEGSPWIDPGGSLLIEQGGEVNSNSFVRAFSAIVRDTSSAWNVAETFRVLDWDSLTHGEVLIQNNGTLAVGESTIIDTYAALTIDNAFFTNDLGGTAKPVTGDGRLNIRNGSFVSFNSARIGTLEISGEGSIARIIGANAGEGTSKFKTLILTTGGRFHIGNNGVIVTNMTESEVDQLITNGHDNGDWNGENGISSSSSMQDGFAIGTKRSGVTGTWLGQSVTPSDRLIARTLLGDTDLSFTVDFTDLLVVAQHYDGTVTTWEDGDFNYDDQVDFNDLLSVAQNYGLSALAHGSITIDQSMQSRFQSDWQLALASVPESATLALLALTPLLVVRRKRSKSI